MLVKDKKGKLLNIRMTPLTLLKIRRKEYVRVQDDNGDMSDLTNMNYDELVHLAVKLNLGKKGEKKGILKKKLKEYYDEHNSFDEPEGENIDDKSKEDVNENENNISENEDLNKDEENEDDRN